jgi:20S proteasome alpha/beta subunit
MTIAAGFRCKDGVLLAADTEISFSGGAGKTYGSKLFQLDTKLGCHLTYSGSADYAKELVYDLKQSVKGNDWEIAVEGLKTTYQTHWDANFSHDPDGASILVTLRAGKKVQLWVGRNRHFHQARQYETLGIGNEQAEAIFNPLHATWMTVAQARYMAIYALQKVKGFVQGCGGKTEIIEIDDDPDVISLATLEVQDVKEIEADFQFFDQQLRPLLLAFSDLSVNRTAFQAHLTKFGSAIKKRRAKNLKVHEKELEEWATAVREVKGT